MPITHQHVLTGVEPADPNIVGPAEWNQAHTNPDIADVNGLAVALAGKANSFHTHAQADVTNLVTDLAGKAAATHTHNASDVNAGTLAIARIPTGTTSTTVCIGNDSRLSDARTPLSHSHPQSDITNLVSDLAGKAATSHTHAAADINSGTVATARLGSGTANSSTFLRGDQTWAAPPGGGSDPWTYLVVGSDFITSSATAVDVTGLSFTPSANNRYLFEASLLTRTATATIGPRPGVAWPTGGSDGVVSIQQTSSATANVFANGNIGAAVLAPVGGLPATTSSYPAFIWGTFIAGASPSGTLRIQLASETAGTNVTVKVGSFLRYRTF